MKFHLYKISGYEECIMALRMSKGKAYSWEKAQEIQDLVYVCTNEQGFLASFPTYQAKLQSLRISEEKPHNKITQDYNEDVSEFMRLLGLTRGNAMEEFTHHTLIKYIDISFFTEGLHRGAQDDLDAHAIAFNNRITRYSTRLAEIEDTKLSEWYDDKLIPLDVVNKMMDSENSLPESVYGDAYGKKGGLYKYTPFGYMLDKFANMSHKSGLYKDVARGGMPLGMESNAIWKTDLFNLRYVYHMRSKLTKANPELKNGMEQLADQIEMYLPVFGPYFRKVFTDTKEWEHTGRVKTITKEEYELLQRAKAGLIDKSWD